MVNSQTTPEPRDWRDSGSNDPTERSIWRPLRLLLGAMDDEIAVLYAERGLTDVRPRFAMPLIRLGRIGSMTIKELADGLDVTHSAMSQTVNALRRYRLVVSKPGPDARTREVILTNRGKEIVPFLEAEWRATERAVAELESELPYRLTQVVSDMEVALARESFHDRIVRCLAESDRDQK